MLASYGYDDRGRRTGISRGNGTSTGYGFDALSRLSSLTQDIGGSSNDQTLGFSYNPASQITQNTRSNDAFAWTNRYDVDRSYASNGLDRSSQTGSIVRAYDGRSPQPPHRPSPIRPSRLPTEAARLPGAAAGALKARKPLDPKWIRFLPIMDEVRVCGSLKWCSHVLDDLKRRSRGRRVLERHGGHIP